MHYYTPIASSFLVNQAALFYFICQISSDVTLFVRCALEAEVTKYVNEAYPKGVCAVYCTNGKDVEEQGSNFELVVVISAARHSPQNFWYVITIKPKFY